MGYLARMKIRTLAKRRTSDAKGVNVYTAIYGTGKTELIYTGHCVPVSAWDVKKNMPKNHEGQAYKAIKKIDASLARLMLKMELEGTPITPATLKRAYMDQAGAVDDQTDQEDQAARAGKTTVIKLVDDYLDNGIFHMRKSTRYVVKSSLNKFKAFLKEKRMASLERKQLNNGIIAAYSKNLIEQDLSINNRAKLLKHLKVCLKYMRYDKPGIEDIKVTPVRKKIITLTLAELEMLKAVDCSKNRNWQKAKDIFILGTVTGLRLSDVKRLNPINTHGEHISLKTLKNSKDVKIPILSDGKEVLERYNYHAPKMSANKVNKYIKEVCKKAKINARINIEVSTGDKVTTKTVEKWEVITSHVASKTFITLAPERWTMAPAEIAHLVGKDLLTLIHHYFNDQSAIGREKMIANDKPYMKVSAS